MTKTKWYAKPIVIASEAWQSRRMARLKAWKSVSILVALALVLSLGIVALPMAGTVEANSITWTEYPDNPVFDGINRAYYPRVLAIDGTYHMWYTDTDSAGNYQVGYTTSADGISWETADMVTGLTGTPNHVVVVNVGTEASPHYRIWYANAAVWPYNVDLFRTAESDDGINWCNDVSIGADLFDGGVAGWWYGSYGPGAVLYNPDGYATINDIDPMGNKYVMYYDIATMNCIPGETESTALAYSADGINWYSYGDKPIILSGPDGAWDSYYTYVWSVIKDNGEYHAWYSGGKTDSNDGIGYLHSSDGLTWIREPNPVLHVNDAGAPEWRQKRTYTPNVIKEGDTYKMWFSGVGSDYSIGYATAAPPVVEVEIDIKPGSDPNSINLKSKGVVPVAVLTTDDFDASDVDPDTVTLFPTKNHYGDVTLSDWDQGNFDDVWDLTQGDLTLSYTIDMSAIANAGWAVTEVGLRETGGPNIDPNLVGGWMQSNYISATSNPDSLNMNDMHLLSKHGWLHQQYDAEDADTLITPYWSGDNYGFWFDRDGVDQWQANLWGNIDGATYNTEGVYEITITYHAIDDNTGTMFATINGVQQGLYIGGWKDAQPEFYPAGRSFEGDMTQMQLFYGRGGGGGYVTVSDITVTGRLAAGASAVRWTLEDVDGDGDIDLLFHFKTQELNLTEDSTEATLTGATYGGTPIEGTDTVNIVPKGKK